MSAAFRNYHSLRGGFAGRGQHRSKVVGACELKRDRITVTEYLESHGIAEMPESEKHLFEYVGMYVGLFRELKIKFCDWSLPVIRSRAGRVSRNDRRRSSRYYDRPRNAIPRHEAAKAAIRPSVVGRC